MKSNNNDTTILLIEDDTDQRELYREMLVAHGFIVLECKSLKQAKKILNRHMRIVDRVICDNFIKDEPIGEIVRHICDVLSIPTVLISGLRDGSIDFEKPVRWPELIQAVELGIRPTSRGGSA